MPSEEKYMERALELARKGEGRTNPNPAVGAVVVRNNQIVGEGYHPRAGMPHAEIYALRQAGSLARGADLYVTLEPCSHPGKTMACTDAILRAGISRVIVGCRDPNPKVDGRGLAVLGKSGVATFCGLREKECRRLIAPFAKHVRTGLPYVMLKAAMTLDGKIATVTGDSRWISNDQSRLWVHGLRDRVDAIMVGAGTVLRDDPRLTTRLPDGGRDPIRIVVDQCLDTPVGAQLLHLTSDSQTIIAASTNASTAKAERLRDLGAEILQLPEGNEGVDLRELMEILGRRNVQSILLEGGSRLNGAMWRAGLIDRIMICVAAKIVGGEGLSPLSGKGVPWMAEAVCLKDVRVNRFGDDVLIEGEVPCSQD